MDLIFVGGSPRSGTTLVQKILNGHSEIYGGPEFDHLPRIMTSYNLMKRGIYNNRQEVYYNEHDLSNSFKEFIESFFLKKKSQYNTKYISEKTPDNILVFDELLNIFPNAKFIVVIRDPRAILNSFCNVYKRAKESNINESSIIGRNLNFDLSRISKSILAGDQFVENNKSNCFVLYYEDLVKTPKIVLEDLCAFLNIPFESEMLNTSRVDDISLLLSKGNKNEIPYNTNLLGKKIQSSSINQWRRELSFLRLVTCQNYFDKLNIPLLNRYILKNTPLDKIYLPLGYLLSLYEFGKDFFIKKVKYR